MSSAALLPISSEPVPEQWFAVQTRYRFEKRVTAELANKGMQVYLPLRRESRSWGDRKKEVLVPVFPGYAFVRSDRSVLHRLIVLQTAGVMGFASTAAAIPDKQIRDLQLLLAEEAAFSLHPFVKSGQRMRIRGGRLDGLEGLRTPRKKEKLMISIEVIQRSLAVDVHTCAVEGI